MLLSFAYLASRTNFAPQAFGTREPRSSKTSPTAGPIDASCTRSSPNSLSGARASFGGVKWWRQLSVRAGPWNDDQEHHDSVSPQRVSHFPQTATRIGQQTTAHPRQNGPRRTGARSRDHIAAAAYANPSSNNGASPISTTDRRAAVVIGALLVTLFAGLAAGGVFSGAGTHAASLQLPSASVPTTAASATTQQPTARLRAPSTALTPGESGAQGRVLQRALESLGFSAGSIDGRYGQATKDAVTRFQRSARLTADGILGPSTLPALARALAGP
jgi:Putative peptidoglycan binding domain